MISKDQYVSQLDEALAFIKANASFLVVSHVQPDGDAISSTVVVDWLLERMGKKAVLVNESELPSRLNYLRHFDQILSLKKQKLEASFDAVIAVDCADNRRMGEVSSFFPEGCAILNIDHHPTNNRFGSVNVIQPHAAATAEILFDLIERAGMTPDLDCATAIYTGLMTDTGGFRYSNTSPRVMEIAAKLLETGVSGSKLADHLLEKMTMAKLKLLQMSLARLTFSEDLRIGWVYIGKNDLTDCGAVPEDLEGIVNYALNVDGVEVGILFKETNDGAVKASLRSAGKADVAAIAQTFGGGGHVRASGCRLDGPIEEAIRVLVDAVRKALV
ncbi:bifunctional oligoribonuclease/PAP phosphatase NrnA [Paenibacillus nanensis]|uniref:Bifunctional oligoribonuclease/PAP phosphatase NrnA n=1 Tax=Paenibacillus nanensis TaxID=393251 RepID=A0A3A1UX68_9BACL|nr:bifunctional oligoribonuclease/PAP phosphatase NrnA [Paenibacillus nanensis]RIX51782.1 bifunctional oligoribonuclease/PAP phosphatase NrnA [Paenibacillus nanensis]